jgi:predicted alpha/beta-fold hydrolase
VPDSVPPGFRPPRWLTGGHRQTLVGYGCRRYLGWPFPEEDLLVEVDGGARLLGRASWQAGPREERPLLIVLHGLGGSDRSPYALSTGRLAFARGWHVLRVNLRGAGDSEALCQGPYNAGLDTDILAVVEAAGRTCPRVSVVGFSLGASMSLLALGRRKERLSAAWQALVAVCPPLDLSACAAALERRRNWIYQDYFMKKLRAAYARFQRRLPHLYQAGRERTVRTIREFDEAITAYYGGYDSADDYYSRSSAGPWLTEIGRRVLILAAADDPFVPGESVARWPLPPSGLVEREMAGTGGHVGFVSVTEAPGFFWAAERALDFLSV